MKLVLKIAAGIVLAVVILGALFVGVPKLIAGSAKSNAEAYIYEQCEEAGIAREDCRKN